MSHSVSMWRVGMRPCCGMPPWCHGSGGLYLSVCFIAFLVSCWLELGTGCSLTSISETEKKETGENDIQKHRIHDTNTPR